MDASIDAGQQSSLNKSGKQNVRGGKKGVCRGIKPKSERLKIKKEMLDEIPEFESFDNIISEGEFDDICAEWKDKLQVPSDKFVKIALEICWRCAHTSYSSEVNLGSKQIEGYEPEDLISCIESKCYLRQFGRFFANFTWNKMRKEDKPPAKWEQVTVKKYAMAAFECIDAVGSAGALEPEEGVIKPPTQKLLRVAMQIKENKLMKADNLEVKSGSTSSYITGGRVEGNLPSIINAN
nr:coat protein [Yam virus Y]QDF46316.1 coat protein [Yam virus Y]